MGRLQANYNSSKNNKISIKKQNLGGGRLLFKKFAPNDLEGLMAWLDASKGITTSGNAQFISQVVISDAITTSINGTYTRSTGGHTGFDKVGGGTGITWDNSLNIVGAWVIGNLVYGSGLDYWFTQAGSEFDAAGTLTASNYTTPGVTEWRDTSSGSTISTIPWLKYDLKPQFIASSINGKPAVRTSSVNSPGFSDLLYHGSYINQDNTNNSIFIVLKYFDVNWGTFLGFSNEALALSKKGNTIYAGSFNQDLFQVSSNIGPNPNIPFIISSVVNNSIISLFVNGVFGVSQEIYFGSGASEIVIGSGEINYGSNNTNAFVGDIAEVLVYNRPLTDSERQKVETYLNEKYSIY
jgi:hypothetical protein